MYYKINNGSITLSGNTILENIDFSVTDNEKIGIVGRNGTGKTTLLKAIIGEIELEDGYDKLSIEKTNDFRIGYVKQNAPINKEQTMLDYILESYNKLTNIENEIKKIEIKMTEDYTDKLLNRYNTLTMDYKLSGGYTYKKEYETALKQFGFTSKDKEKRLSEFSGGQLTKLAFLKLLLSKPDLLILDEPTNHLDITTIEWLEEYLKNYSKSLIVVSHDQMFLDNVCNVIYDIEYGSLKRYSGNYSYFIKKKEEDYQKQLKDYEKQQKEIKRLQAIADRFRYKPTKASMAMSKLKQIEKMAIIDKPQKENLKTFKISFNPEQESYKEVLKVKDLSIGYDKELSKVTFNIERGDKLGIIGANGIGKSTLLKTLIGEVPSLSGKFTFGNHINLAYFSQQLENLNTNSTIYDEIDNEFPTLTPNEIRTLLGAFEFTGEDVFKKIGELSGGEKVRVSLCKILYNKPNLLILDEPTNHLDIISKNTIKKMLNEYKGSIIMVSHDRYLVKSICNKLLVFNHGKVDFYKFGYEEYLLKKTEKEIVEKKVIENPKEKKEKVVNYNLSKDIQRIERKIEKDSQKVKNLQEELYKKEVYMDISKSQEIQKELDFLTKEIEKNTSLWEELVSKM
ncbi:MAG: ABC-F family ATP-binding cassette domain-containing protein [Bacilli bacterium]|nr:ABC-F family ATP-binding cassette domain-containing protein [Bacilli bacterium]